jgi:WD40 repeat protein
MKTRTLPIIPAGFLLAVLGGWSVAAPVLPAGRPKEIISFQAHPYDVENLAFSPDGNTLASGGREGRVKLWDVTSGKNLLDIEAHPSDGRRGIHGIVQSVVFSPDGKTLASGGDDRVVNFWDVATGRNIDMIETWPSWPLIFSPDGKSLLIGIEVWNLKTKKRRKIAEKFTGLPWTTAFDSEGNPLLASASGWPEPPCIWLWDAATGKKAVTCKGYEKALMALAFSRDGKTLASAGYDQTVRLWNAAIGKNKATFDKLPRWSSCGLTFSPDGKVLAMNYKGERERITDPGHILLLEVPSGKIFASLQGHKGVVLCVAFSLNDRLLASGDVKGVIKIWSLPARYKAQ